MAHAHTTAFPKANMPHRETRMCPRTNAFATQTHDPRAARVLFDDEAPSFVDDMHGGAETTAWFDSISLQVYEPEGQTSSTHHRATPVAMKVRTGDGGFVIKTVPSFYRSGDFDEHPAWALDLPPGWAPLLRKWPLGDQDAVYLHVFG